MAAEGDRVIAGTMRPDGTMRKERKIRPGYVPLEEQEVYVSRGAKFRDGAKGHVPGIDPQQLQAAKAAALAASRSKSAKKNEKRKEKKAAAAEGSAKAGPDVPTGRLQQLSLGSSSSRDAGAAGSSTAAPSATATAPPQPSAASAAVSDPADIEKQIRALQKKVRQCEVLAKEAEAGSELNPEEQRKLGQLEAWQKQLSELEAAAA